MLKVYMKRVLLEFKEVFNRNYKEKMMIDYAAWALPLIDLSQSAIIV